MDGLKQCIQKPGDDRVQNYFYSGWTSNCYVSNLFAFAPDGTISVCILDAPGSLYYSTVVPANKWIVAMGDKQKKRRTG